MSWDIAYCLMGLFDVNMHGSPSPRWLPAATVCLQAHQFCPLRRYRTIPDWEVSAPFSMSNKSLRTKYRRSQGKHIRRSDRMCSTAHLPEMVGYLPGTGLDRLLRSHYVMEPGEKKTVDVRQRPRQLSGLYAGLNKILIYPLQVFQLRNDPPHDSDYKLTKIFFSRANGCRHRRCPRSRRGHLRLPICNRRLRSTKKRANRLERCYSST